MVFSLFRRRANKTVQHRRIKAGSLGRRMSNIEVKITKLEDIIEIQRRQINRIRMRQIRSESDNLPFNYPLPYEVANGK
jgi:hypothetical protein